MLSWLRLFLILIIYGFLKNIGFSQSQHIINQKEIVVNQYSGSVEDYLKIIENEGIILAYSSSQFNTSKKVRIAPGKYKVDDLLIKLFEPNQVEIKHIDSKVIFRVLPMEYTIYGFVYDAKSREVLPGATLILSEEPLIRLKTDDYGHYSATLKLDKTVVTVRYTGYFAFKDTLHLSQNKLRYDVLLFPQMDTIQTVDIKNLNRIETNSNSHKNIASKNLQMSQSTLGTPDLIRALQLEPGVNRGSAGSGELSIRGGSADQNLILLDGIPVYNYSHLFGLSSIFNTDILKNTDLFTGSFPAKYDGRLSSVIDIKTKDGNMNTHQGNARLGILDGSIMFEGPIKKEKSSYMVSLRRSWLDLLKSGFSDGVSNYDAAMLDLNLKLNYKVNPRNRIFLSTYFGDDDMNYGNKEDSSSLNIGWKNKLLALRWHRIHKARFAHHSTIVASEYYNNFGTEGYYADLSIYSRINDIGVDNEFKYYGNNNIIHTAGFKVHRQQFESLDNPQRDIALPPKLFTINSLHMNAYIDNEIQVIDGLLVRAGIHYANFSLKNKSYNYFQPRTSVNYQLSPHFSFFAGYATMAQFYNQISLGGISLPMELRIPSTRELPPQQSIIYEAGYRQLNKWLDNISVQFYLKKYHHIIQYRNFQSVLGNRLAPELLDRIVSGTGESKGIEVALEEKLNKISTKLSYSYSKTTLQFPELNNGNVFSPRNDLRNVLTGGVIFEFNSRWKMGANFRFSSGQLINIPMYTVSSIEDVLGDGSRNEEYQVVTNNTYRMAYNYDINMQASWTKIFNENSKGILSFGMNNITHRPIPIFSSVSGTQNELIYSQIYPLRFVPNISYSYAF